MKPVIGFFLLLILNSCNYFTNQVPKEGDLLQAEIKKINWDEVDQYPSFSVCDSIADVIGQKECFFETMASELNYRLKDDSLAKKFPKLDSLEVQITILPTAEIVFKPINLDTLKVNPLVLDSILQTKLHDFQKINPALKKGIPVKTQFVLPFILKKEAN